MRKLTAVILTLCLLLGSVVPSFATVPVSDFTDVSSSDWFYTYVKWGVDNDYFAGTSATTFSPNDPSTREQFMKVFANYAGEKKLNNNVSVFADVESGRWSAGAIKWALDKSITAGVGGGKFNPTGDITRQQAAVFVANFAKWYCATTGKTLKEAVRPAAFSDADSIAAFAESSVDYCVDHGLLTGYPDGTFKPAKIVTRAEFATILHAMEFILGVHSSGGGGGTTTTYVYSITYDLDGGAWATGIEDQNERTSAMTATSYDFTVTAEIPEKDGFIFDHWENQADGATVAAGDTLTATKDAKDITVKAIYIDANDLILLGVKAAADAAAGYIDTVNNIADNVNNGGFGVEGVIDSIGYDENGAAEDNSAALED
ncbi:MAG: S-layer homology domain-containing protein, partial [Clostridia bacterium]|nr:S-layer homology domain-containing protein [Clostridia bacterium]